MGRKRLYSTEQAARRNRELSARRSREQNESVKEIGPLPEVEDPKRKERCRESLLQFMLTYGGSPEAEECFIFTNPFCDEQVYMIETLEQILKFGGEMPLCIFRGGCKTTICEWGITWAMLYGWQKFGVVAAASLTMARNIIRNIKVLLEHDPLLAADFPEACFPILALERTVQRARAQVLDGEPTEILYGTDIIRLPRIEGADSSQAIVQGVGADSSFRGLRVGKQRPTVVLIDDPQTNRSARSLTQTEARWNNIASSMKGLAGPGVALAMAATVTVIRKGDLAEKILERWAGKRFGILRSMPKNMKAWDEYADEMDRNRIEISDVKKRIELNNLYYLEHRAELDEGAEAAWESNFAENEVSAIQHAMNLYYFDQEAFWSEYMNLPVDEENDAENLTEDDLERKIRKELKKGTAPEETVCITCGIDIQKDCLFWMAAAWSEGFSGHVLDYGRYPKGRLKMENVCPGKSLEEQVSVCLRNLAQELKDRLYFRDGSREELCAAKVIVDANWGAVTNDVKKVCRQFRGWLEPTFGWGKGPDSRFFGAKKTPGEERGPEWRKPLMKRGEIVRAYTYNTNWWKSFVRLRIKTGIEGKGSLSFYGGADHTHQKLWKHLLGESSSKLAGQYGTIDKWVLKPGEPNHWWDCLVMAAVAASAMKIQPPDFQEKTPKPQKKNSGWIL